MKRFTKCICFFLIATMLFATSVCAAENPDARASNFFAATSVYLEKTTGNTFQIWFDVTAVGTMDELGAKTITVQRSSDDKNWTDVKTFSKDTYLQMMGKDTFVHDDYVTYTGATGYYYRAYVVLYAKDGNNTGEAYKYTTSIKF